MGIICKGCAVVHLDVGECTFLGISDYRGHIVVIGREIAVLDHNVLQDTIGYCASHTTYIVFVAKHRDVVQRDVLKDGLPPGLRRDDSLVVVILALHTDILECKVPVRSALGIGEEIGTLVVSAAVVLHFGASGPDGVTIAVKVTAEGVVEGALREVAEIKVGSKPDLGV